MKAKYVEYGGKLALICAVCMLGVAGAFVMAKDRIEEGKQAAFNRAIQEVLGIAAEGPAPEAANPGAPPEERVYVATVEGQERYAAEGAHQGFSSKVRVAVGARVVEDALRVIEVRVISQNETPGLGTKIKDEETNLTLWSKIGSVFGAETVEEKDWWFLKQYREKGIGQLLLTDDAGQAAERIVKITGVTITTNACTEAVKKALERIREHLK